MNGSESEGDWESLLDSGQLDDNIKKLTILPRKTIYNQLLTI